MKNKSERTFDDYINAGAYLKLFAYVWHLGHVYLQPVMPKVLWNCWHTIADRKLVHIKAELEDRMFKEYPRIERDEGLNLIHVFYGSDLFSRGMSPLDAKTNRRAREIAKQEIMNKLVREDSGESS